MYKQTHPGFNAANCAKRRDRKGSVSVSRNTKSVARIYELAHSTSRVKCYLCGKAISNGERHVDHIVPLAKGGEHSARNLAIACAKCNLSKNAKMPAEVGLLL
jgi:5-methylcytosine-specific restriction endonuclease McrA